MKNNILILGSGLLAIELVKQTNYDFISRKHNGFDITDINTFNLIKPYDIIINCIANTDTYSTDKQTHWDVNYKGVDNLVNFCNKHKIKLVHISTDYIYSNSNDNTSEDDVPVHCNNWYGYTKLLGDAHVQLKCDDYLLIRCTHKPKPFTYDKAWINQIGNFDYVDVIVEKIIKLLNKKSSGIYNVGTDLKSMYDLAKQTKSDVLATISPDYVPSNTSMNISKLNKVI
jgi:dTDP-4-dehydrorhamnose reductase